MMTGTDEFVAAGVVVRVQQFVLSPHPDPPGGGQKVTIWRNMFIALAEERGTRTYHSHRRSLHLRPADTLRFRARLSGHDRNSSRPRIHAHPTPMRNRSTESASEGTVYSQLV